jgi:hypothetical protein
VHVTHLLWIALIRPDANNQKKDKPVFSSHAAAGMHKPIFEDQPTSVSLNINIGVTM